MFTELFVFPRGTICVLRIYGGELVALALEDQLSYREWTGCFCLL